MIQQPRSNLDLLDTREFWCMNMRAHARYRLGLYRFYDQDYTN